MTAVLIEAPGGSVDVQALMCFERLRDLVDGTGRRIGSAPHLVVEVSRRDNLIAVMRARSAVFGDEKPQTVSNRVARLPRDELVRLTVELDPADHAVATGCTPFHPHGRRAEFEKVRGAYPTR